MALFRLVHDEARRRAVECVLQAPVGYVVRVSPPTRSLEQNAALHAALQDISRQLTWCGERLGIDEWKRLLTLAWCRAEQQPVRVVRAYNAGSGRECRELAIGGGTASRPALYCEGPAGWEAARPLLRGGAVARP